MLKQSINVHLTRKEIIKSGSVYTSPELVNLVFNQAQEFIDGNTVIGDFGSGYGAFIEKFKNYGKRCFGTECDDLAYNLLKNVYFDIDIYHENSLLNVNREKYSILEQDKLMIIGNPPYNDTTSIFKKGEKGELICDSDLKSRDFGLSFLKAYNKLKADYICVLHPLSYLIKKQNFTSLGDFKNNYKLISGTIFSSKEFESIKKNNSDFPVVSAIYKRDEKGMDYDFIRKFKFKIYREKGEFILSKVLTIDGLVGKYPTSHKMNNNQNESNLTKQDQNKNDLIHCLQFYTLRDMNSLLRNTGFVEGVIPNGIDVTLENLYQYSWLYFLKINFNPTINKFLYGNLSPLYSNKMNDSKFKSEVVYYAYYHCDLVKKYMNLEKIKSLYGPSPDQYSAIFDELENIYSLFV